MPGRQDRHVRVERRAPDDPRRGAALRRRRDRARTSRSSSTATCRPTTSCASCSPPSAWTRWRATRFEKQIEREKRGGRGDRPRRGAAGTQASRRAATRRPDADPDHRAVPLLPGHGHRHGRVAWASPPAAIMSKGTIAQKERWALDLLTLDKIGAWAITEPGSGSDAFGSMKCDGPPRRRRVRAQRLKTFITNGPYADTIVFICKLDEGNPPARAQDPELRARPRHAGPRADQAAAQDGHALLAHRRAVPRRRARRHRPPHRRDRGPAGRWPRRCEGDVPAGALRRGRDGARHHRAVPRAVACSTPRTACSSASRSASSS